MPNRRELIRVGVAAGVWPLAATSVRAAWSPRPLVPVYKVVFDRRHRQSVEFATHAHALGIPTLAIAGDMTRAWYDDVHWEWCRGGTAIAGMTEHGALFCFDQLARDYGMRAVFRGEHTAFGDGSGAVHELWGLAPMLDACRGLDVAGERWPRLMAEAVSRCPIGHGPRDSRQVGAVARGTRHDEDRLYTWVIAPSMNAAWRRGVGA